MTDLARLDVLISRYLDGLAGAADLAELDAAVCASPDAARRFAALARIDGDLRAASRASGGLVAGSITQRIAAAERQASRRSARRFRTRSQRRRWVLPLAAALVAALGALAWLAAGSDPVVIDAPFLSAGRAVPSGTVVHGTLEIQGGGSVVLEPGSQAEAAGSAAEPLLRLDRGRVACVVAPRAHGRFAITTPHGSLSVIGTVFTVEVGADTLLSVREGTVEAIVGEDRQAVSAGAVARLGGGVRLFKPTLRLLGIDAVSDWNNNSPGVRVTAVGDGPTGAPAVRLDLRSGVNVWASCRWRPAIDWRDADGISLILSGVGSGRQMQLEIMDDGPEPAAGGRDGFERFVVTFADDVVGWHERRFPFTAFTRRVDLWPGMPNDGFGRERVHGLSLILDGAPFSCDIERIALYRE
jgi:ferric-dicitrate binding protein FerR (iron transport regulator)